MLIRRLTLIVFVIAAVLIGSNSAYADTTLFANITAAQENPQTVPTLSTGGARPEASGTATFTLNSDNTAMTFTATINNLDFTGSQTPDPNDNLTAAHIHAGPAVSPTTNGGVVWGFFGAPLNDNNPNDVVVTPFTTGVGGTIRGKWDAPEGNNTTLAAQLANILAGRSYINFHTKQFGGGEIRGNIIVGPGITTKSTLQSGTLGASYSQTLAATGGAPPYAWSVQGGALPTGLTLSSAGVISGTPTVQGTSTFTIGATDSASIAVNQSFSLAVVSSNLNYSSALRVAHVLDGAAFSTQFAIVNLTQTLNSYRFRFWDDDGNTLIPPIQGGATGDVAGALAPGAISFAQTAGSSTPLLQGWAEVASTGSIGLLAIVRLNVPGSIDSQAAITGAPSGSNVFLPFDNTQGSVTGVAIANSNPTQSVNISMLVTLENGAQSTTSITIPAHGHTAFALPANSPATVGSRGTLRFIAGSPDVSVVGLRFGANNTFVSLGGFQ